MRDIFEDIFAEQPLDPMQAARRGMRPDLRKRFYEAAAVAEKDGAFAVTLDGKEVRTPARRSLAAPKRALAQTLAAEWDAQRGLIDPAAMPLTRLANSIIDGVADQPQPVADEIVRYITSDLLLYRAEQPQRLVEKQAQAWDPILAWAADAFGARFILVQGVVFAAQPKEAIAKVRAALPGDVWRLGAMHAATTLTGSGLLALALAHDAVTMEEAWRTAHVDEDWQIAQWGEDALARQRQDFRLAEFAAAAKVLHLVTD
jgi:chaperone required for assembly of F1-ATPase